MDYRKERNFIVAYDGDKCRGKWNILTNEYVGIKGAVVKSKPTAFSPNVINMGRVTPMLAILRVVHSQCGTYYPYTAEHGKRLEEIASVGLIIRDDYYTWRWMTSDKIALNKECVQYITDNFGGVYSQQSMDNYRIYKDHKSFLSKLTEQTAWASDVIREVNPLIPKDFVHGMIMRGIHEKVFFTYRSSAYANLINNWYSMIQKLGDKLEVKHNILTNYSILQWLHNEYKNAHYDDELKKNNDKPFLYFENEEYFVRPLLSRQEFHDEAEAQHNCVERMYMDYVYNNQTYVVTVRKKSNPTESFITCEVNHSGRINQYLYGSNRYVHGGSEYAFKLLYQEHLTSSLKE